MPEFNPYSRSARTEEVRHLSSEHDVCPVCGETVNRTNLAKHYKKVHPRRYLSLTERTTEAKPAKKTRIRNPRRAIFYALVLVSVVIVAVAATQFISANTVRMSIKPQLSVLIEGASFTVPASIGVDQTLWRNHSLDRYGVGGRSPLQTQDTSGTIYVESNTVRNFTLHEFLEVWGESVDPTQVVGNPVQSGESACTLINGQTTTITDNVVFADQQKITLEIISGSCSATS